MARVALENASFKNGIWIKTPPYPRRIHTVTKSECNLAVALCCFYSGSKLSKIQVYFSSEQCLCKSLTNTLEIHTSVTFGLSKSSVTDTPLCLKQAPRPPSALAVTHLSGAIRSPPGTESVKEDPPQGHMQDIPCYPCLHYGGNSNSSC